MVFALLWVFCTDIRTDSDFCFIHHWLIGFYNRGGKCLLRGTYWFLILSRLGFVFKRSKDCSRLCVHRKNNRWYHLRVNTNDGCHCSGKVNPTDSMKKNLSWKADTSSVNQEISRILWNAKEHRCVRKNMPFTRILGQMNPVRALLPFCPKINLNTI